MEFTVNRPVFRLQALVWMLAGSAAVFFVLYLMNQFIQPERPVREPQSTTFEVQREVRQRPRPQPRPRRDLTPPKVTPPPALTLGGDISGIDFGLPSFDMNNLGGDTDKLLGDTDNVVMTSDMVDTAPQAVTRAEIQYPRRAAARQIEGYVVLSILIDANGHVQRAKVIEADPAGVFESEALQNIQKWIFRPATYGGKPVKTWANQTIRFQLG